MRDKSFNKIPEQRNNSSVYQLTQGQILILKQSDLDIEQGRVISHDEVMKNALASLKETS